MRSSAARKIKPTSSRKPAGDKVFEVAADLFYRKGVRAIGVEEIVRRAGVAKISLYRAYSSKDDLIVAYLDNRNAEFWRQWDEAFDRYRSDPRAQLRAIMAYLSRRTTQPGYLGCPFINFCGEFRDASHPGRKVAEVNKREMRRRFVELSKALGAVRPQQLADGLLLLVEGAYAVSQTLPPSPQGPGSALAWAADALIEAQLRSLATDEKTSIGAR